MNKPSAWSFLAGYTAHYYLLQTADPPSRCSMNVWPASLDTFNWQPLSGGTSSPAAQERRYHQIEAVSSGMHSALMQRSTTARNPNGVLNAILQHIQVNYQIYRDLSGSFASWTISHTKQRALMHVRAKFTCVIMGLICLGNMQLWFDLYWLLYKICGYYIVQIDGVWTWWEGLLK